MRGTLAAAENIEAICAVDGIDCMIIPPFDLSIALALLHLDPEYSLEPLRPGHTHRPAPYLPGLGCGRHDTWRVSLEPLKMATVF